MLHMRPHALVFVSDVIPGRRGLRGAVDGEGSAGRFGTNAARRSVDPCAAQRDDETS